MGNPSDYALVQDELARVDQQPVARAFAKVKGLAAADAGHVAGHAFGILLEGLTLPIAQAVQAALAGEGIGTQVARAGELTLPPTHRICGATLTGGRLAVREEAGARHEFDVREVKVVTTALVEDFDTETLRRMKTVLRAVSFGNGTVLVPTYKWVIEGKVKRDRLILDLVTDTHLFRAKEERFHFPDREDVGGALDPRGHKERPFLAMAATLAGVLDRRVFCAGITAAMEQEGVPIYPSLRAFEEEARWRLYQGRKRLLLK